MEDNLAEPHPATIQNPRVEKIKNWLKNPTNLILVAILAFAVIIRFYYFWQTKTQPFWWDEAAYGSLAKNYITHMWDGTDIILGETKIRPPLFPILWSMLMRINIGEVTTRFLLEFLPSVLSVFFVWLTLKEFYNKRTSLIATAMFSVLWIHLFYTSRLLTNVPALPLMFISIYFFSKSLKKDFNQKYFAISLILLSLATLMRYPVGLTFFAFLAFLIITKEFKLIKNTKFWISGIIGVSPLLLFFLFNYITKGNIFPAILGGDAAEVTQKAFAFNILSDFIPAYLTTSFLVFFLLGLALTIFELSIGFDLIKKNPRLKGHLILLLIFIAIFGYFIFYIRAAEDRWLFPAALSMLGISAVGLNYAYELIKKHNKQIAIIGVIGVLAIGGYAQIKLADSLIEDRKGSFLQMKQGMEWIRDNTPPESIIQGQGLQVYAVYYAERNYEILPPDAALMENTIANYLIVHSFAGQPPWINDYLNANQDKWQPEQAYFFDPPANTQPAFIVYKSQ
jgi:4-amino-4-deoxy-L-arabinose transferase-like glycosyltransferase